jgi:SAM-dependent methyltransferase
MNIITGDRKNIFETENYLDKESGYPERNIKWFKTYILSDFISLEFINNNKKLLDVGCAFGYFTRLLSENFNETLGIDFSDNRINYAKTHETPKLKFKLADLTSDSFIETINDSYDLLFTSAVIQHIDKNLIPKVLKNLYNVAAPGAHFVMYDELAPVSKGLWERPDRFVTRFTIDWLVNELQDWKLINYKQIDGDMYRLVLQK